MIMPCRWNADRRRSQAQADFWNPTRRSQARADFWNPTRHRSSGCFGPAPLLMNEVGIAERRGWPGLTFLAKRRLLRLRSVWS